MNQYKRLLQVPKSYYIERNFPCSKSDSIKIVRKNNKKKKDFSTDDSYKQFIITEYYKQQIDNILLLNNDDLKTYIELKF